MDALNILYQKIKEIINEKLIENKHKHVYEWLEFGKLEKEYFYPIFLKEAIFNLPEYMQIISNYD